MILSILCEELNVGKEGAQIRSCLDMWFLDTRGNPEAHAFGTLLRRVAWVNNLLLPPHARKKR